MAKRSPRYPRHSLSKALEMTRKLYEGAHQARVDVDTAARVIGYASSTGGAAASAIGALRQFGLVDGLRGDLGVSDLAMRILEPMDEQEQVAALHEAVGRPEIFGRIFTQFGEKPPASDEPIRAYLIRHEGFSSAGANELIGTLRETLDALPEPRHGVVQPVQTPEIATDEDRTGGTPPGPLHSTSPLHSAAAYNREELEGELIVLPLGSGCKAELRFIGEVTPTAYDRLMRHLQLLKETLEEEE